MFDVLQAAAITWLLFIPIAIGNGTIRDIVYKPKVGDLTAHQVSTVIAIILFLALSFMTFGSTALNATHPQLLIAGLAMVCMTIVFEFSFGHFLRGFTLPQMLHDYDIKAGRIWSLFLLAMLFAPSIIRVIKQVLQ